MSKNRTLRGDQYLDNLLAGTLVDSAPLQGFVRDIRTKGARPHSDDTPTVLQLLKAYRWFTEQLADIAVGDDTYANAVREVNAVACAVKAHQTGRSVDINAEQQVLERFRTSEKRSERAEHILAAEQALFGAVWTKRGVDDAINALAKQLYIPKAKANVVQGKATAVLLAKDVADIALQAKEIVLGKTPRPSI